MVTWYKFTFGVNVNLNLSIISSQPSRVVIDINCSFIFFCEKPGVYFSSSQTQSAECDRWINLSLEASNEVSQKNVLSFLNVGVVCVGGITCVIRVRVSLKGFKG